MHREKFVRKPVTLETAFHPLYLSVPLYVSVSRVVNKKLCLAW